MTTPPQTVTLTFNDRVLDLGGDGASTLVHGHGPGCGGPPLRDRMPDRRRHASCPRPSRSAAAGTYTVTYQIVSADGHTVSDSLEVRVPAARRASRGGRQRDRGGVRGSGSGGGSTSASPTGRVVDPGRPADRDGRLRRADADRVG